jgi:hypothetical protein
VLAVAAMPMTAVHEKVHQRTQEKWQVNERAEHVSAVLGEQQRTCNDDKAEQYEAGSRVQQAALWFIVTMRMSVHRHSCFSYSTMSRPRNIPIGHENSNSPRSFGSSSTATV